MLEVIPGPDHVLAIRVSGTLTGEDYDQLGEEMSAKLKRHERIGILVEMLEIDGIKPAALAKDLRYAFARIGEFHRFPRAAVITQKKWLRTLAAVGDAAFPGIEIRTYEPSERERALMWVAALPAEPRMPALRVILTTRKDTYGFVWNGKISVEDAVEFENTLRPVIEKQDKMRLLGRIERLGGIVPGAITESGLFPLKSKLFRKIERYAIVGGPPWLPRYLGFVRSWSKVDVRHFDLASENDAWAWLDARPIEKDQASDVFALHVDL
jgi:SpoIIAA-like